MDLVISSPNGSKNRHKQNPCDSKDNRTQLTRFPVITDRILPAITPWKNINAFSQQRQI